MINSYQETRKLLKNKFGITNKKEIDETIEKFTALTGGFCNSSIYVCLMNRFDTLDEILKAQVCDVMSMGCEMLTKQPNLRNIYIKKYPDLTNLEDEFLWASIGEDEAEAHPEKYDKLEEGVYLIIA